MSIGRQKKHQPIALSDILADEHQLTPGSDSDAHDLDRMHIHIDMPDSRYWGTRRLDTLARTSSGGPQSTVAYQDVASFSSVSPFNFPATADAATLLTPISGAGSPPLRQRPSTRGTMRAYHQSQPSGSAQQPTPPNTSTGVYYPAYELSSSSQSPSPLTVHPHPTEYAMTPYIRQSPGHLHGHPSPKDDVPPPIDHYLGHYTVSGGESNVTGSFRDYADFNDGVAQVDPSFISRAPTGQMTPMHQQIMTASAAGTPILGHPDPTKYRMHMPPRPGEIEGVGGHNILSLGQPGPPPSYSRARVATTTPRRTRAGKKQPAQSKSDASRPPAGQPPLLAVEEASENNDTESLGDGDGAVTLSDRCEDEARFIFETRKALVQSGMKGKGMWEEISRKYEEVYGQRLEKATLQMRLTRTFAKHAIWPDKEIDRLKEAFEYVEQRRYKLILARMREMGGGQCWNWTPQLIEAKLIDLGYEEANVDEKTNTRKRRRLARRRRRAAAAQQNPVPFHGSGEHWRPNTGLGLHHAGPMHAPPPMHHHHHHADNDGGGEDPEDMLPPHYTAEQRDRYIEEVVGKIKSEQDESSPEPDMMDVSYHGGEDGRDQSHQQSTQVAKQAVEQLMLNGVRM